MAITSVARAGDSRTRRAEFRARAAARVATSLVALFALAVLTACGDGDNGPGPTPTPSATVAPSITPLPTATPVVTPTGAPGTFPIASDLASTTGVAASWGGDGYLVTFADQGNRGAPDVFAVRLSTHGDVQGDRVLLSDFGASPFLGPDAAYSPSGIASAASGFGVFLFGSGESPAGPPGELIGFVQVPLDAPPVLPATAIDEELRFGMVQTALSPPVAATSNGTLFLGLYQRIVTMVSSFSITQVVGQIVTVDGGTVQAQEIGPFSGTVSDQGVGTTGSAPGVAIRDDGTALAAWVETVFPTMTPAPPSTRLQSVLLTADDATSVTLAETSEGSQGVAVASDGDGFLVVWQAAVEGSPTVDELRAIRFTPGAAPEPEGGFVVAGGATDKALVDVAFAGGVYLVVWIEDGALRGARLGTVGTDAQPFTVDEGPAIDAAVATDGERFLVAFDRADGAGSDVVGTFVERD